MELVRVALVMSTLEAELIAARLRSEGIDAVVLADTAGGAEPQLAAVRGVRVMVRPEDEVAAALILDEVTPLAEGDGREQGDDRPDPSPSGGVSSELLRALAIVVIGLIVVGAARLLLVALGG